MNSAINLSFSSSNTSRCKQKSVAEERHCRQTVNRFASCTKRKPLTLESTISFFYLSPFISMTELSITLISRRVS